MEWEKSKIPLIRAARQRDEACRNYAVGRGRSHPLAVFTALRLSPAPITVRTLLRLDLG